MERSKRSHFEIKQKDGLPNMRVMSVPARRREHKVKKYTHILHVPKESKVFPCKSENGEYPNYREKTLTFLKGHNYFEKWKEHLYSFKQMKVYKDKKLQCEKGMYQIKNVNKNLLHINGNDRNVRGNLIPNVDNRNYCRVSLKFRGISYCEMRFKYGGSLNYFVKNNTANMSTIQKKLNRWNQKEEKRKNGQDVHGLQGRTRKRRFSIFKSADCPKEPLTVRNTFGDNNIYLNSDSKLCISEAVSPQCDDINYGTLDAVIRDIPVDITQRSNNKRRNVMRYSVSHDQDHIRAKKMGDYLIWGNKKMSLHFEKKVRYLKRKIKRKVCMWKELMIKQTSMSNSEKRSCIGGDGRDAFFKKGYCIRHFKRVLTRKVKYDLHRKMHGSRKKKEGKEQQKWGGCYRDDKGRQEGPLSIITIADPINSWCLSPDVVPYCCHIHNRMQNCFHSFFAILFKKLLKYHVSIYKRKMLIYREKYITGRVIPYSNTHTKYANSYLQQSTGVAFYLSGSSAIRKKNKGEEDKRNDNIFPRNEDKEKSFSMFCISPENALSHSSGHWSRSSNRTCTLDIAREDILPSKTFDAQYYDENNQRGRSTRKGKNALRDSFNCLKFLYRDRMFPLLGDVCEGNSMNVRNLHHRTNSNRSSENNDGNDESNNRNGESNDRSGDSNDRSGEGNDRSDESNDRSGENNDRSGDNNSHNSGGNNDKNNENEENRDDNNNGEKNDKGGDDASSTDGENAEKSKSRSRSRLQSKLMTEEGFGKDNENGSGEEEADENMEDEKNDKGEGQAVRSEEQEQNEDNLNSQKNEHENYYKLIKEIELLEKSEKRNTYEDRKKSEERNDSFCEETNKVKFLCGNENEEKKGDKYDMEKIEDVIVNENKNMNDVNEGIGTNQMTINTSPNYVSHPLKLPLLPEMSHPRTGNLCSGSGSSSSSNSSSSSSGSSGSSKGGTTPKGCGNQVNDPDFEEACDIRLMNKPENMKFSQSPPTSSLHASSLHLTDVNELVLSPNQQIYSNSPLKSPNSPLTPTSPLFDSNYNEDHIEKVNSNYLISSPYRNDIFSEFDMVSSFFEALDELENKSDNTESSSNENGKFSSDFSLDNTENKIKKGNIQRDEVIYNYKKENYKKVFHAWCSKGKHELNYDNKKFTSVMEWINYIEDLMSQEGVEDNNSCEEEEAAKIAISQGYYNDENLCHVDRDPFDHAGEEASGDAVDEDAVDEDAVDEDAVDEDAVNEDAVNGNSAIGDGAIADASMGSGANDGIGWDGFSENRIVPPQTVEEFAHGDDAFANDVEAKQNLLPEYNNAEDKVIYSNGGDCVEGAVTSDKLMESDLHVSGSFPWNVDMEDSGLPVPTTESNEGIHFDANVPEEESETKQEIV
ncbi:conserved Plasmodium protein, unknown function [Plasmodium ovale curtisi]|uniref:Uncharacterized protein n=1 Tax=Plasmodium ovale curtisi TaxID=864141 RepID=A0A1A8VYZ1_PLAOA|nr:conserved Plasmodium protein, unknown function [Plasmodium ovale curtisi]